MADSERYNHDMIHVPSIEDNKLVSSGIFPIAVVWDIDDVISTMVVRPGTPQMAFMRATATGILPDHATLPRLAGREGSLCREIAVDIGHERTTSR